MHFRRNDPTQRSILRWSHRFKGTGSLLKPKISKVALISGLSRGTVNVVRQCSERRPQESVWSVGLFGRFYENNYF